MPFALRLSGALSAVAIAVVLAGGCRPASSAKPTDVVDACTEACEAQAAKHCSEHDCERGCMFVLDRLVEHEQKSVLACVSSASGACDDALWARCAVYLGSHADGGPPPPPPPPED
jgi:hypothetical protein